MSDSQEEWKPVVGYEGWYEVSNLGRVRRVAVGHGTNPGRILKGYSKRGRYSSVVLFLGCRATAKTHNVHQLVASAFLGVRPDGCEINHIDGNKSNPALTNLEYVTKSGNQLHSLKTGLRVCMFKDDEIRAIRAMMEHIGYKKTAKLIGIERSVARKIKLRLSYSWVD